MRDDDFIGQEFCWFTGEVLEIDDTEGLNRVKVYAHGYYPSTAKDKEGDKYKNLEHLPWATVMMPTSYASIKGNGGNHHLEIGSWVVGFFRDGTSAQDPIVMGSIATQTDGTKDLPDTASVDNKVYHSKGGHKIEMDNAPGDIKITHASGSSINMKNDGNIYVTSTVGDIIVSSGIGKKTKII
jgi:hypothetical protein